MKSYNVIFLLLFSTSAFANTQITALHQVDGQIVVLQKNITENKTRENDLVQQLRQTEISIGLIHADVNHFNEAIQTEKNDLDHLKAQQTFYETQLKIQHELLDRQIYTIYKLGQTPALNLLLNQEDPGSLNRYLVYSKYLSNARSQLMLKIKKTLPILAQTMQQVIIHQKNLEALCQQKEQQEALEQASLKTREQVVKALSEQNESQQDRLNQLVTNQKALKDIVTALKTVAKNDVSYLPFDDLKGKLQWPVKGTVQATYGSRNDLGNQHLSGVILKAPVDTPVRAIYSGKVIFANWLRGFGLLIIINHGNNYMSLYGRNQALYAKVGDTIHTGEVIAETGNSGGYAKPGLYFEIRQNGIPVNPSTWCV